MKIRSDVLQPGYYLFKMEPDKILTKRICDTQIPTLTTSDWIFVSSDCILTCEFGCNDSYILIPLNGLNPELFLKTWDPEYALILTTNNTEFIEAVQIQMDECHKTLLEKIKNPWPDDYFPILDEPLIHNCWHEWKDYVGFTERYKYCTKCDAKDFNGANYEEK